MDFFSLEACGKQVKFSCIFCGQNFSGAVVHASETLLDVIFKQFLLQETARLFF